MQSLKSVRVPIPDRCSACVARKSGPCGRVDIAAASEIASRSSHSTFESGTEVLRQGAPTDKIGIVISGLVKIVMLSENGDEHVLQLLHAGEVVGDPFAEENVFTWQAATDVELCWMTRASFETLLAQDPSIYRGYLGLFTQQLQEQQFAVALLRGRNTLERMAFWLWTQLPTDAPDGGKDATPQIRILLSRRDLASLLDMSVETLCRALRQLDDRGAINMLAPDLVEVTDRTKLRLMAKEHDESVQDLLSETSWEWGARMLDSGATDPSKTRRPARRLVAVPPPKGA